MRTNPQFYADMFTFTEDVLNGKVHFFVNWFVQVNRQKTTVKKNITYFYLLYSYFLKSNLLFFTARCFNVRFWDLLYFICLKFNPQFWYLLLRRKKIRKCVDLLVIFKKGRQETFAVSLQNPCVCIKY